VPSLAKTFKFDFQFPMHGSTFFVRKEPGALDRCIRRLDGQGK